MHSNQHDHLQPLPAEIEGQIKNICDSFEVEWRQAEAGEERPEIDEFFATCQADYKPHLARRLLEVDLRLRRAAGEMPVRSDYDVHFLAQYAEVLDDLFRSAESTAPNTPIGAMEGPGSVIGNYKLLQQIGTGGFGVVFMAEQQKPLSRRVAFKIIKPGMDTKDVIARFEAERQTLAMLDHPNVAKVFDAGATPNGRPYFVMELIKGVPITDYCDQNRSSTDERLRLFFKVCHAVQHAHQKGIIHRDLKPSNIMVTLHDGQAVPKVIDFGVSKAINQRLTEKTLFTSYGQMIGTPQYMSPEQAEMSGLDIDTRSDIYSLGVVLYELIAGSTPLDAERLRAAGLAEMQRMIREEEPPKPSVRLSSMKDRLTVIAKHRSVDPRRLRKICQGDLDWIVLKCLEKERSRRYETSNALAADITRFLANQTVEACPPSAAYRVRKFARRNKFALAAGLTLAICLLAGVVGTTIGLWRASRSARDLADGNRKLAIANRDLSDVNQTLRLTSNDLQHALRGEQAQRLEALRRGYNNTMVRAHRDWERGDVIRAHLALRSTIPQPGDPDMRGFEWYLLWHECKRGWDQKRIDVFRDTPSLLVSLAVSGEAHRMAFGHSDASVTMFDLSTNDVEYIDPDKKSFWHETPVSFSHDGQYFAFSADERGVIVLRNLRTGDERLLRGYGAEIIAMSFSPDGKLLAAAGSHGGEGGHRAIWIWDVETSKVATTLDGHRLGVTALSFSPNGRLLASGGNDGSLKVWNVADGTVVDGPDDPEQRALEVFAGGLVAVADQHERAYAASRLGDLHKRFDSGTVRASPSSHGRKIWSIAFSPDGTLLGWTCADHLVRLWQVGSDAPPVTLVGHRDEARAIAFDPNSTFLATGDRDNLIKIWDFATLSEKTTLRGHTKSAFSVAWFPGQERQLVSVGGEVIQWDLSGEMEPEVLVCPGWVSHVAISNTNQTVAAISNGLLRLWNLATGATIVTQGDVRDDASCLDVSPNDVFAVGRTSGTVELVHATNGKRLSTLRTTEREPVTNICFDHRGETLLIQDVTGKLQVWDCNTSEVVVEIDRCSGPLARSPNGRMVAYVAPIHRIMLMDLETGRRQKIGSHKDIVICMAISPDGNRLATAGRDSVIRLWSIGNLGESPDAMIESSDWPSALAFSNDGSTLYAGHGDRTIRMLDVETLMERCVFERHVGSVRCLAVSRDDQILVSGSTDHTIRIWRSTSPDDVDVRELDRVLSGK